MPRLRKILFPTDFSESAEVAFNHAVTLASHFNAKLILFHAVLMYEEGLHLPEDAFPELDQLYHAMEERARASLAELGEKLRELRVERVVARGISASEEIVGYAKENKVDLIVMGTHGRKGLAHLVLGSVTDHVIRHGPVPVLTARTGSRPVDPAEGYKKIVVPTDLSEHSEIAGKWAVKLAEKYGAELHFVHVVEDDIHPAYFVTGKTSIFELIPEVLERSQEALARFARRVRAGSLPHKIRVLEGEAHVQVAQYAEAEKADLIVAGTRGLKGIEHILLGSTTERIIRRAPCAVLVTKKTE
ncbi:MAG: universal stress protein [Calditrichaeota bacterium]|nr:universal stress protein [Calditrichota bacterium]